MASKAELREQLEFRKAVLNEARSAYIDILKGRAQSYAIGSRNITKHNLNDLLGIIEKMEKEVNELEAVLNGGKRRKAVGIVPRDW